MGQIYVQYQLNMNHSLQTANFSSSSDEEDERLHVPSSEIMGQYNRQYSMVVKQVERFLKQTTQCVQRFVAFHNFGVNFNLPHLLSTLNITSNSFKNHLVETEEKLIKDPKILAKNKYQISFNRLIQRMADLLHEMLDCQIQFKQKYFGMKAQQDQTRSRTKIKRSLSPLNYSISSMTKSSKSQKMKLQDLIQNNEKEEIRQAELRDTLKERLKPKTNSIKNQCKLEYSTTQNLYRLNQKIDQITGEMKFMRNRQQKLIQLFNLNRVKNIHSNNEEPFPYLNSSSYSAIPQVVDEGEEEMDSILQSWRQIRKDSDSLTENKELQSKFLKKRKNN